MDNVLKLFCPGRGTNNTEDAVPIVDGHFMLVADGLGGSGGFAHPSVVDGVKNENTFFETLFGMWSDLPEESMNMLRDYVMGSFKLYNGLPAEEKSKRTCDFRSGYFASRFVAALMYHHFLSKDDAYFNELFEKLRSDNADTEKISAEFADGIKAVIKNDLTAIAKNGNFIYEAKTKGLILLPTTLVTIVYKEYDEYVDAVYLWAGDSRGYYWQSTGLKQVTEDHENDGVMTNLINLNRDFGISCKYVRIPKPCVLFATSDGCYSCMTSPLDFEYYFMSTISDASSMDDAAMKLEKLYRESSEDDTNTVALMSFGYSSFDELKSAVKENVTKLYDKYNTALPGIFTENFDAVVDSCKRELRKELKDRDISKEREIVEIINARIEGYESVAQWRAAVKADIESKKKELEELIRRNYIPILSVWPDGGLTAGSDNSRALSKNSDELKAVADGVQEYRKNISVIRDGLKDAGDYMLKLLDELYHFRFEMLEDEKTKLSYALLDDLLTLIEQIYNDENDELRKIKKYQSKLLKASEAAADKDPGSVAVIASAILENKVDLSIFKELPAFEGIAAQCGSVAGENAALRGEKSDEAVAKYWSKRSVEVLIELYAGDPGSDIWSRLGDSVKEGMKTIAENQAYLETREKLYQEHYAGYQLIREENDDKY